MTANRELAELLRIQADDAMRHRKALLCASAALATTTSVPAAIRALGDWDGPPAIKTAALDLIDTLTRQESPA